MARCQSCEIVYINGMRCHEIGCPERWHDDPRECLECGREFRPDEPRQRFCCDECADMYFG